MFSKFVATIAAQKQSMSTSVITSILLLQILFMQSGWTRSLKRTAASSEPWNNPCEDIVRPHVTLFPNMGSANQKGEDLLTMVHEIRATLRSSSALADHMANMTEAKLGNKQHSSGLREEPIVEGIRHEPHGISDTQSPANIVPVISHMYNTLTRVAIFLHSISADLDTIEELEEKEEMKHLLRVLEQGGYVQGNSEFSGNHYGIYNQLCDMYMELPVLLDHSLSAAIIPAEHAPGSSTRAQARDRNYRILNNIHNVLLELLDHSGRTLPSMEAAAAGGR